jgi:hypothetical protein
MTPAAVESIRQNPDDALAVEALAGTNPTPAPAVLQEPAEARTTRGSIRSTPSPRALLRLELVRVEPNQTIVRDGSSAHETAFPNLAVHRVVVASRNRGAAQGALVGALAAGVLMLGVAATHKDGAFFSRGGEVEIVGLLFGLPLVLIGSRVGAHMGAHTTYIFE